MTPAVPQKKWHLAILNPGLNGQTENVRRLQFWLQNQGISVSERLLTPENGFLKWVREIRHLLRQGNRVQIHVPSAAFLWPLMPFFPFGAVEFFLEGHLIEWRSSYWQEMIEAPRFFLPRFLVNRSVWVRLLCRFWLVPRVMVASRHQGTELLKAGYPREKIVCVPNCPPTHSFRLPQQTGEKRVFGYLGHGTPVKGLDTLAKAFEHPMLRGENWELKAAVGLEGAHFPQKSLQALKQRFPNQVTILGVVDPMRFLEELDVIVLPYRTDFGTMVFPVVLIDALHAGVLPLLSDFDCVTEPLGGMRDAHTVPPNDPSALAEAMKKKMQLSPLEVIREKEAVQAQACNFWGPAWTELVRKTFGG